MDSSNKSALDVLNEMDEIRCGVSKLEEYINKIEKNQGYLISVPVPDRKVKEETTELSQAIQRLASSIKKQLLDIKKSIDAASRNPELATASCRIQKSHHDALWKKFTDALALYNQCQVEYNEKCKARLKRQLAITGANIDEDDLNDIVDGGNLESIGAFATFAIENNLPAQQALIDVQLRNDEIKNLEKDIVQLKDLFLDVSMLVSEQGEAVNHIESYISQASASVVHAKKDVSTAVKYKEKLRKRKWYCCLICSACITFCVLCIIVAVVIFVFVMERSSSSSNKEIDRTANPHNQTYVSS